MIATQLRSLRAPLKANYRNEPLSALLRLRAEGFLTHDVSRRIRSRDRFIDAGLHPALRLTRRHCIPYQTLVQTRALELVFEVANRADRAVISPTLSRNRQT